MEESISRIVRKHRNIFHRGGGWSHTLLAAMPWVSAGIVALLLIAAQGRFAVVPGTVFELPDASAGAAHPDFTALMMPLEHEDGEHETLVFFDDERYSLTDADSRDRLEKKLGDAAGRVLLLMADRRMRQSEISTFAALAARAEVARLEVASKPE